MQLICIGQVWVGETNPHTCPIPALGECCDKAKFKFSTPYFLMGAYIRNKNKWPTLVKILKKKFKNCWPTYETCSNRAVPSKFTKHTNFSGKKMLVSKGSYFRINVHLRFLMGLIINPYKSIKFNNKPVRYTKLTINTKIIFIKRIFMSKIMCKLNQKINK